MISVESERQAQDSCIIDPKSASTPLLSDLVVVHAYEDMNPAAGGVAAMVRRLSSGMASTGANVRVVHALGNTADLAEIGVETFHAPPQGFGKAWWWGPTLTAQTDAALRRESSQDAYKRSVLHVHGVWSAVQWNAMRAAAEQRVPAVLSAHGMLEPWLWEKQGIPRRLKKWLYWRLLAEPSLSRCVLLHAITAREEASLRRWLPGLPIMRIPNAVSIDQSPPKRGAPERRIVFLGRIDPVKGVDLLIEAFGQSGLPDDWHLDIVGPVWNLAYGHLLRQQVERLALGARVVFHGPLFGEDKQALLDKAWMLVAPSHSEVMGLVNLEAAAAGIPSVTTFATGLDDWQQSGGGLLIEPTVPALVQALQRAAGWPDLERMERGLASWRLVRDKYSWSAVLPSWQHLYSSVATR